MEKGEVVVAEKRGTGVVGAVGLILRSVAMVVALILAAAAAATLAVIRNDQSLLDELVELDLFSSRDVELVVLVSNSETISGWLIVLNVAVIIAEGIAIALLLGNIRNLTARVVLDVFEIIFSYVVMFCYAATGIAGATYAKSWAGPPEDCANDEDLNNDGCADKALTATISIAAGFSLVQAVMLGVIGSFIIYSMAARKSQ